MKLKDLLEQYGNFEVTQELLDMIKPNNEDWKPSCYEDYCIIDDCGEVLETNWYDSQKDNFRLSKRNVYKTKEEAQFALDMYCFCKKRSFVPDWNDSEQNKYYVRINHIGCIASVDWDCVYDTFRPFYYPTEEAAKEVVAKYSFEELAKYYGRV